MAGGAVSEKPARPPATPAECRPRSQPLPRRTGRRRPALCLAGSGGSVEASGLASRSHTEGKAASRRMRTGRSAPGRKAEGRPVSLGWLRARARYQAASTSNTADRTGPPARQGKGCAARGHAEQGVHFRTTSRMCRRRLGDIGPLHPSDCQGESITQ